METTNVLKIDDFSISVTVQPETPEPVVTVYVRSELEARLLNSKVRQDVENAMYADEQAHIQSLIDLCTENGVIS